jgi:hypothetical protein
MGGGQAARMARKSCVNSAYTLSLSYRNYGPLKAGARVRVPYALPGRQVVSDVADFCLVLEGAADRGSNSRALALEHLIHTAARSGRLSGLLPGARRGV